MESGRDGGEGGRQGGERAEACLNPLGVGLGGGGKVFDIGVAKKFFGDGIDGDHFARSEAAFLDDGFFWDIANADFGAHDEEAIFGDFVAGWAESVAVEASGDDSPVAKSEGGGTIPRFVEALMIFVEGTDFWGEAIFGVKSGRDEHEHGVEGAAA